MTLTATIILNVLLDATILGLLAFVMTRPHRNLDPHEAEAAPASLHPRERTSAGARTRETPSWKAVLE